MKWAILLYGLGISGGANVIFEHALYAHIHGVEITFLTRVRKSGKEASWHRGTESFIYKTLEEAEDDMYDAAIATEWRSAFDIYRVHAKKYIYFVQSIESRFLMDKKSLLAYVADTSYEMGFRYITEATWIKKYLDRNYDQNAVLVKNGISKDLFSVYGKAVEKRQDGKVRFLIEGGVSNWLKNVPQTIRLCREAGVDELWLVTPEKIEQYPGVDRLFSCIPYERMPEIYRSCDVLVKLSLVEGMFGPPLEMFHCGGTAITYDIEGAEEYLVNGYNALVIEKGNENAVIDAIKKLKTDTDLLQKLRSNALITAGNWIDWEQSNKEFWNAVCNISEQDEEQISVIREKGVAGAQAYLLAEEIYGMDTDIKRIREAAYYLENKKDKKFFIYGAGYLCKSCIWKFSKYGIAISGIIVSDKEKDSSVVLGHKVYEISEIKGIRDKCFIFISSEKYHEEMERILNREGFSCYI